MKMGLLLPAILFAFNCIAQQPYYDFKKFKENIAGGKILPHDLSKQSRVFSKDSLDRLLKIFQRAQYSPGFGHLLFTYPNGNKVYALPQDNMACLVPDLSQFNMPNAGRRIKITGMPPGSRATVPIIPDDK